MDRSLRHHSTLPAYSYYFLSTCIVAHCCELIVEAGPHSSVITGRFQLYLQGENVDSVWIHDLLVSGYVSVFVEAQNIK